MKLSRSQLKRVGFYPVCQRDHIEPLRLFRSWIDKLYFCDIRFGPGGHESLRQLRKTIELECLPEPGFILGDALTALEVLRPVDLFFQRRDSGGEGGSELFLLGPKRLPLVLQAIKSGGLLVTDGGYAGKWYDDLVKFDLPEYQVGERLIYLNVEQPWRDAGLTAFLIK